MPFCICGSDCKAFTTSLRKHEELNMRPRLKRMIWLAPAAILGILLFIAIGGEIVRLLWNWLLPPLFGRRLAERWQHMTPEEREKFRQGIRGRCGFDTPPSESKES